MSHTVVIQRRAADDIDESWNGLQNDRPTVREDGWPSFGRRLMNWRMNRIDLLWLPKLQDLGCPSENGFFGLAGGETTACCFSRMVVS